MCENGFWHWCHGVFTEPWNSRLHQFKKQRSSSSSTIFWILFPVQFSTEPRPRAPRKTVSSVGLLYLIQCLVHKMSENDAKLARKDPQQHRAACHHTAGSVWRHRSTSNWRNVCRISSPTWSSQNLFLSISCRRSFDISGFHRNIFTRAHIEQVRRLHN